MKHIILSILIASMASTSIQAAQPKKPRKKDAVTLSNAKRTVLFATITQEVLEDVSTKNPSELHDMYRSIKQQPSFFYLSIIDAYKEQGFLLNARVLASVTNTVMNHLHTELTKAYGPDFDTEKSIWKSVKDFFTCRGKAKKS